MDEGLISAVWRYLTEGGGVGGGQAAGDITHGMRRFSWVRRLGSLGFGRGGGSVVGQVRCVA